MINDLTPVELHGDLWIKREDLNTGAGGVNGSKLRACRYLISQAVSQGARSIISASSVLSPQAAMAAVVSREYGVPCHIIIGGTTPEKAIPVHRSLQIASEAGASFSSIAVGYNPALQKAAKDMSEVTGGWVLPYGITTDEDVEAFMEVGGRQVLNIPPQVQTLVLPFGSGNTAAGVLYGLRQWPVVGLRRVVLLGIGPDRQAWLSKRLSSPLAGEGVEVEHIPLHPKFATYGDRMPGELDGIVLHPTYEGKCVRYLNMTEPEWWRHPDSRTLFWIVGGPLP